MNSSAPTLDSLPAEIVRHIVHLLMEDGPVNSRSNLGSASLINRRFYYAHCDELARLPQRTVTRRVQQTDVNGAVVYGPKGKPVLDNITCTKPEVVTKSPVRVSELLAWQDLDQAYRCVLQHRENLEFWRGIRVILVAYVENHRTGNVFRSHGPRRIQFRKAHWVFLWLAEVYRQLYRQDKKINLEWLRIEPRDGQSIMSMDAAGMFGLSQMPAIPHVCFVSPNSQHVRFYVATSVSRYIRRCTSRKGLHSWTGNGTETAWSATPWRELAEQERQDGESDLNLWYRWMARRLGQLNVIRP